MARNVKWKVNFKTINDRDAEVLIYEDGWTGDVTDIEPAENPITTEEDNNDEFMTPVRTWTGYLRVIDNGDLEGLMPTDNQQHYVELLIDNVLKWCGYMQADTFSEDWDIAPLTVEFPLISPIGVLDSVYLDQTKEMGVVTLASLIVECIDDTGVDYEKIYLPKEVTASEASSDYMIPLTALISRYNFFSQNNSVNRDDPEYQRYDADTCMSFLKEFCKFWGWTMREREKNLYFISTVDVEYLMISVKQLRTIAEGESSVMDMSGNDILSRSSLNIETIELAGDNHKQDMLQGYNKFIIRAKINAVSDAVPSVDYNDMNLEFTETYGHIITGSSVRYYERIMAYTPLGDNIETYIYQYEGIADRIWKKVEYTPMNVDNSVGATFVKRDYYNSNDLEKKRNYNYTECLRISLVQDVVSPKPEKAKDMIILRMRGEGMAKYSEGAFVISASTSSHKSTGGEEKEGNGRGPMEIMFRVGTKYWDGEKWGDSPSWFIINMGNEEGTDQGTGQILSTKTLDMPYNGADGYLMIIDQDLSGEVELSIHAIVNDNLYDTLYLSSLKVEYYKDDNVVENDRDDNKYGGQVNVNYSNIMETELSMSSNNRNKAAYSILSHPEASIESLHYSGQGLMRPELWLLGNQKRIYGRVTEKLTMQVERNENFSPIINLTGEGNTYKLLSESINWAEETEEIMIENIP